MANKICDCGEPAIHTGYCVTCQVKLNEAIKREMAEDNIFVDADVFYEHHEVDNV